MIPKATSSLDFVEIVMVVEEFFGTEIPDVDAVRLRSPREIVDWLELHLSKKRPNEQAAALLRKLADDQESPDLAKHFDGTWRREQIAAVIGEVFRNYSPDDSSDPTETDAPVRAPLKPRPQPRSCGATAEPER